MDWLDDLIGPAHAGTKTTQVLRKSEVSPAGERWQSLAHGQFFWVRSHSPASVNDVVTFYSWLVTGFSDGEVFIECGSEGGVIPCSGWSSNGPMVSKDIVSLCAGLGGIDLGAHRVGWSTKVMNDISELATSSLAVNFSSEANVIKGDIHEETTVRAIHACCFKSPVTIASGFPCQPYSTSGNQRGFEDSRARVLIAILRCGWLVQCEGLILECVAGAGECKEVRTLLKNFCSKLGMQSVDGLMRLERLWPCRRCRWWFIGTPADWTPVRFRDLPQGNWKRVKDIFHAWPVWDPADEQDLAWDDIECAKFRDIKFGKTDRRLPLNGVAPTALHSQGAHFRPCPCGCRAKGFSEERLITGGLHCIEVRSGHDVSVPRHPHPAELGYLQGIDLGYQYLKPVKDQLCLVGQVASPFQAAWACLLVDESRPDSNQIDIEGQILLFAQDIISQRDEKWVYDWPHSSFECKIECLHEPPIVFRAASSATVQDFIQAQQSLAKASEVHVFRHGRPSLPEDLLRAGEFYCSIQEAETTSYQIELSFLWCGRREKVVCAAGTCLFEVVPKITDGEECAVFLEGADTRIPFDAPQWSNECYEIASLVRGLGHKTSSVLQQLLRYPDLQRWFSDRRADGTVHPGFDGGLDDVTMMYATRALIEIAGATDLHFVSPRTTAAWLGMSANEERDLVGNEIGYFDGTRILALVGQDNHWSVLDYTMHDAGAEATCVDGITDRLQAQVQSVASIIHGHFGFGPISHVAASCYHQGKDNTCGAVALLHIGWRLGLWHSFDLDDVKSWYSVLRWGVPSINFRGGGGGKDSKADPLEEWLRPFLEGKGVPKGSGRFQNSSSRQGLGQGEHRGCHSFQEPMGSTEVDRQ